MTNCCGQIFDPKPYLTTSGVCFASQSLKAESGIMINYDTITVTVNCDNDKSSGNNKELNVFKCC
jgi:hypothetical protein